jgi:predicted ester cyclase
VASPAEYAQVFADLVLSSAGKESEPMSTEDNKALLRYYFEEAFVKQNYDVIDEIVEKSTFGDAKAMLRPWHSAFTNHRMTVNELVAEGDKVAASWTSSGAHTGEFLGIPPTGKSATWEVVAIYTFANGKIVSHNAVIDILGLLGQLGAEVKMKG